MKKKIIFTILTISISLLICLIGGEILARLLIPYSLINDERNLVYRYDNELGWFPIKNSEKSYKGSHLINVKSNEIGFRDVNHGVKTKQRIAFVGDSFVWGYDVEQDDRFTEKLQSQSPNSEIINMGVSGYGTDQELILIEKWFDHFKPDIVFLVFCDNDWDDNKSNSRYGGYYKPYFKYSNNTLEKCGTPVPMGLNYYHRIYPTVFKSRLVQALTRVALPDDVSVEDPTIMIINKMKDYVNSKDAKFVLAFVDSADTDMKQSFCESNKIQHLFLSNSFKFETGGNHWTPEGHEFVSNKIYKFLVQEEIIDDSY